MLVDPLLVARAGLQLKAKLKVLACLSENLRELRGGGSLTCLSTFTLRANEVAFEQLTIGPGRNLE